MVEHPADFVLLILNIVVILGFLGFAVRFWQGHP
jgi:hypothetical protein